MVPSIPLFNVSYVPIPMVVPLLSSIRTICQLVNVLGIGTEFPVLSKPRIETEFGRLPMFQSDLVTDILLL